MTTLLQHKGEDEQGARSEQLASSPFDLDWIGRSTGRAERRQVVVLAIGFEKAAATDPEEIADLLARRRGFVARIVSHYRGTVGRVDPDLQIAAWGWPVTGEADARLAVAAALDIAAEATAGASCGVDAGIAITPETDDQVLGLGFVGEMIGRAVAQQAHAPAGGVVVSDALGCLIADAFELTRCERGEGDAAIWSVDRKVGRAKSDKDSQPTALIGRDAELARLVSSWRAAVDGRTELILLEGEAGVGRSALVAMLERKVVEGNGTCLVVNCLPESQQKRLEPVRMLVDLLAGSTGMALGGGAAAVDCRGLVGALPLLVRQRTAVGPLAIVLEDLQWADEETLRLVGGLEGWGVKRLLVAGTRRRDPGAARLHLGKGWQAIEVARLKQSQIEQLLTATEHGRQLGRDVRRRLAARADGIPLHACELARLCAGTPDPNAHHRLLARPNRLNAALTSRLDALAVLKPLAQAAAILGRMFDSKTLAAALDMDVRVLDKRLGMLVNIGILVRRRRGQAFQYRFQCALLWSQAYGSVLKVRRRKLHLKIATVLSGDRDSSLEASPQFVAYHWKKAGEAAKAFQWWSKAAHKAAGQGASASAVSFVNEALAAKLLAPQACPAHEEAVLLSLLGTQLRLLRGSAAAETVAAYERALQVATATPTKPTDLDLDIAWGLAAIHLVRGDIEDAAVASAELVEAAGERGRDDILLLALRIHGTARLMAGRVPEAIVAFEDAAARYDPQRHGDLYRRYVSDPGAVALAHLSSAQALAGNGEGARCSRRRALVLAERIGHPHTTANVLGVLSLAAAHLAEPGVAAALSRVGQTIASEHGHKYWDARARLMLAWETGLREPVRGFEQLKLELERYRRTGAGRAKVFVNCLAAETAIRADLAQSALDLLQPVRATGERQGEWLYIPEVMRLEALAALRLDPSATAEAMQELMDAEAMARDHGAVAFAERAAASRLEVAVAARRARSSLKRER